MQRNQSPWICEFQRTRPLVSLSENIATDIAIIGGGISGVMAAYFLLKDTSHHIVLIEGNKIGHGATGHNAGQLLSFFERPFEEIVKRFGFRAAVQAQQDIFSAWDLLDEIYEETKLQVPLYKFTGYKGFTTLQQIQNQLRDHELYVKAGFQMSPLLIWKEAYDDSLKPYRDYFSYVSKDEILTYLETKDLRYIAALPALKGCLNSAFFCENLIQYLLKTYPGRFSVFENTFLQEIFFNGGKPLLLTLNHSISAEKIVLCTNGFDSIKFKAENEEFPLLSMERLVQGVLCYMLGSLKKELADPKLIQYYLPEDFDFSSFYVSGRNFQTYFSGALQYLFIAGGPGVRIEKNVEIDQAEHYMEKAQTKIDLFLKSTFNFDSKNFYDFSWNGLMGYTPNGIRCVGSDPKQKTLIYNIGCNGVGILPAIWSGKRISTLFSSKKIRSSIFDPENFV